MKEVVYYISDDNVKFDSRLECEMHEQKIMFDTNALKFYDKAGHRLKPDFSTCYDCDKSLDIIYNNFHRVVVDRDDKRVSKFLEMLIDDFGWCLLEPLYGDDGTVYVLRQGDEYQYGEALVKLR